MVVTFGEMMLRLSTQRFERLTQSHALDVNYGGSEANVAMALAGFGTPNSKDEPKNFNKNIVEVYNQIGFEDEYSCIYDFDKEEKLYNSHGNLLFYDTSLSGPNSTDNSIGVHIAKKE